MTRAMVYAFLVVLFTHFGIAIDSRLSVPGGAPVNPASRVSVPGGAPAPLPNGQ